MQGNCKYIVFMKIWKLKSVRTIEILFANLKYIAKKVEASAKCREVNVLESQMFKIKIISWQKAALAFVAKGELYASK